VEKIVDRSGEDALRRDLASKEERIADLLRQLAVATQVTTTTTQLAATLDATTVEKIVDRSSEDALRRDLASKEERIADLLRQLAAVQELTGAKNSSEGAREKTLHDELRTLKDGVAERESAISQLKTRIADLEKAELSHSSEVHALKGKYTEVQELFEKACAERNAINSKVKNAESAEALAKNSLEHKTQDLVRIETELKALKEQMRDREETGHRMIELQARVTAREADIVKLKEGETTAARELARVKGELEAQTEVNGKQIAEIQALAKDAKLCVIEREHKLEAQGKLRDALAKIQTLEEQVEQFMVLRSSDESRNREAAYASVQDSLADKDAEFQRVLLQLEEARGDLEAARRDREAMVARQTQSLQDELLRVNEGLKAREIQVADLEQQRVQLLAVAATKVDSNIVEEWKRSAALKEAEIEELRRNRNSDIEAIRTGSEAQAASLAQLRAQIAEATEERNALDRRAKAVADELKLSREENDNLKRQLKDFREGKQSLDSDIQMLRSKSVAGDEELRAANAELAELRATCVQLRAVADKFAVMRERVRAAEAEVALANTRLEQLDSVQRSLERKERDLMEERERCDRLRAELQDVRGGGGARGEWESKNARLEARLTEVESARRQAEFDLTQAHNDRAAMDTKISELGEELASARVRITSLESSVKMAQSLGGESNSQLEERIRDLTSSKERYERKYRETQQELKEAQEALARSRRRVQELQEALDTSVGPNDSVALRFFRRPPARVSPLLAHLCMF
jgi:chromosome segregation ATPase